MTLMLKTEDYMPKLHKDVDATRYGIGLIGCGSIANSAHLPAYRKAGLRVSACCDISEAAARSTAQKFDIPFWTTSVQELLEREDVSVIDMAIHPSAREEVLNQIAKIPRPVLCQKPLDMTLDGAKHLASIAAEAGFVLAVNQQARWAPLHKAVKTLLDRGVIGDILNIQHIYRSNQDREGHWFSKLPNALIGDHGIHYFDLCRYFNDSPSGSGNDWSRIHCTTAMMKKQFAIDPLIYSANIEFGPAGGRAHTMAHLFFNDIVRSPRAFGYTWWVDGSEGSIWSTDKSVCMALRNDPSTVHETVISGSWFLDGFLGSMLDLIEAVEFDRAPLVTPEDNFSTLAMTTAAIRSSREGRVVERTELFPEMDEQGVRI